MAVEASHLSLFPPQLVGGNRQMMNAIDQGNGNVYNAPILYNGMPLLSGTTTETLLPMYGSGFTDSVPANTALNKADSGLTNSLPAVSRKRPRDNSSINPLVSFQNAQNLNQNQFNHCGTFSFLGEDISMQIQQQQLEIDRFIAHHMEKVRMDIEERRKRNSRRIIAAVEEGVLKRLRAKEEEIVKIGKLNWALEEKVKSLCVENQIWRELAQTNEATANALRSNLKQVLAQVQDDHRVDDLIDDAQSCCESNFEEQKNRGGDRKEEDPYFNDDCTTTKNSRWCRNCGKDESCVLLLPCRHLCLCTVCASSINICPVCKSGSGSSAWICMLGSCWTFSESAPRVTN